MNSNPRYQKSIDPSAESVCDGLFALIDRVDAREMEALPSLHDTIDPDALNELFTPRIADTDRSAECIISFQYADYEVYIDSTSSQRTSISLVSEREEDTLRSD